MDRVAWRAIVHGVAESRTGLSRITWIPGAAPGWGPGQGGTDPCWSLCLVQLLGLGRFSPSVVLPRLAAIRSPASALCPCLGLHFEWPCPSPAVNVTPVLKPQLDLVSVCRGPTVFSKWRVPQPTELHL